jgi:prepilin-type N-terminal cleavage/methylation domain-containing protein
MSMRLRARQGFSLMELFTVLFIIAILTALAVPRIHDYKHRYYMATMLSDLRNLAVTEESYWSAADTYTSDVAALKFVSSPDVTITFVEADSMGWSAKATHLNDASSCAVYYGAAAIVAPATAKSVIACQ